MQKTFLEVSVRELKKKKEISKAKYKEDNKNIMGENSQLIETEKNLRAELKEKRQAFNKAGGQKTYIQVMKMKKEQGLNTEELMSIDPA